MLSSLELQVKADVKQLFEQADTSNLFYHNYHHTSEVVRRIHDLGAHLPSDEFFLLCMAGWFHDIAYLYGYPNHEERSMVIASDYLKKQPISNAQIQVITNCIEATKLGVKPRNELEKIIKDADIGYGVTENFFETGPTLRKEWEVQLNHFYTNIEWEQLQYNFLKNVEFYTEYAQKYYQPILEQNIQKQVEKQNKG